MLLRPGEGGITSAIFKDCAIVEHLLQHPLISPVQDYALGEMEAKSALRAQELRDLLGQLGPSFVKVGQALSSRPDLLPKVYLEVPFA